MALVGASIVFGSAVMAVGFLPPRAKGVRPLARGWAWCLFRSAGSRLVTSQESELDASRHYVFMANHQSLFDIPALLLAVPVEFRFLVKRSLFRIPVFGWGMSAAGFIPVDRKRRERARKTFSKSLDAVGDGVSLAIYPEETRSSDGRLLAFQRGGFLMALKSGLDIVPVGIHGTREVRGKSSMVIRPGVVEVRIGTPVDAASYGLRRKDELIGHIRNEVARLSGSEIAENG